MGGLLSLRQRRDFYFCKRLTVTALFEIAAFLAVVNDGYLLATTIRNELRRDFCAIDVGCADFRRRTIVDEEYFVEREFVAELVLAFQFFNGVDAALGDEVLFAARFYDRYFGHTWRQYNPYPPATQRWLAFKEISERIAVAGRNLKVSPMSKDQEARRMRQVIQLLHPGIVNDILIIEASDQSWMALAVMREGHDRRFRFQSGQLLDEAMVGDVRVA